MTKSLAWQFNFPTYFVHIARDSFFFFLVIKTEAILCVNVNKLPEEREIETASDTVAYDLD
jgi:hypothetical protein